MCDFTFTENPKNAHKNAQKIQLETSNLAHTMLLVQRRILPKNMSFFEPMLGSQGIVVKSKPPSLILT